jgi:hypothetical protein
MARLTNMVKQLSRKEIILVNRVLRLLIDKKLTDAGKVLEKLEQTLSENEWNKGYFTALQGMVLALKSKDSNYLYLNQITTVASRTIDNIRKNFLKQAQNSLHKDFDRGFFSAWSDYLKLLKNHNAKTSAFTNTSLLKY